MNKYLIYCLIDPRDGEIRYVGQSSVGMIRPRQRHHGHCWSWEENLKKEDLRPIIRVIQECETREMLDDCEIYWISKHRADGCRLTNLTDGGSTTKGWIPSNETRQRIRETKIGKTASFETKQKMSFAKRGITKSVETKQKMAEARKRFWDRIKNSDTSKLEEIRKNFSEAQKGRFQTEETKKKRSESLKKYWENR